MSGVIFRLCVKYLHRVPAECTALTLETLITLMAYDEITREEDSKRALK